MAFLRFLSARRLVAVTHWSILRSEEGSEALGMGPGSLWALGMLRST